MPIEIIMLQQVSSKATHYGIQLIPIAIAIIKECSAIVSGVSPKLMNAARAIG